MLPGALVTTIFGDQVQAALIDPSRINYGFIALVGATFAAGIYAVRRWLWKTHFAGHPESPSRHAVLRAAALNRN